MTRAQEVYEAVEKLRKTDPELSISAAAKKVGSHLSNYYLWKQRLNKAPVVKEKRAYRIKNQTTTTPAKTLTVAVEMTNGVKLVGTLPNIIEILGQLAR